MKQILTKIGKPRTSRGLAVFCAKLAENKLANDVLIMNLEKNEHAPSDYFVICSCDSEVQVGAVMEDIIASSRALSMHRPRVEGDNNKEWVLVDFFDVVVHIMKKEIRNFYRLEKLWGDAQFMKLDEDGKPKILKYEKVKIMLRENILD